jgi:CBS-domain-containing membrane protein
MRRRLETVEPETSVAEAAELMRHGGCGFLPVCLHDGTVVGVVTDRDIALRVCAERRPPETSIGAIMSTDVVSCRPDDTVWRAEQLMMQTKKMRVIVADERNRVAGVLSITDIAQFEEPLRVAQVLRELSSREFRVESRGLSQPPPPSSRPYSPSPSRPASKPPVSTRPSVPARDASSR